MIVVDTSAIVDALSGVDGTDRLRARLAAEELHAPLLIDFEVVSALRALARRGHLSGPRTEDLLTDYDDVPMHRWPFPDRLRRRAFALRDALSSCDAAYVALAEALECPLVTRDARLSRSGGHGAMIELM